MGTVRVRPMEPADREVLGDLLVAAYEPSGMPPDHEYWQRLRDVEGRAAGSEIWVAELDEPIGPGRHVELAGTLTWCPVGSPWRELAGPGDAEFRMLAVAPHLQGRGVGQALVAAVIDRARADGYRSVVLASADWMTVAHGLYERAGFARTPDRDWSPAPGVQLLAFRLDLDAPDA
ncbi:MAG: GNAT family N-acetyltransferase [Acidimicrobiales bacterium]